MTTPVEKRNHTKFCEFHGEVGHNTDECMHLKKQIEEMLKAGKLSHLIKELKQNSGKEQPKMVKKGETYVKDKALAILMMKAKEQKVGSAGMRVGLQTRRDPHAPKPIVKERVKVEINPEYPEQSVMIGSTLTEEGHNKLCNLLQRNLDIFAWKPADMTGIPRHIAEHRLNVQEGCLPVRQKKRGQATDRNQAIQEEVGKLVEAGIMKEVHYHDWLSNPVMVKKHDYSWRMCVDFKDLNKACPKDGYPLPEID
ncbi:hypothetical protein Tco_1340116, partial [Tanacetum coccineum]